MQKIALVALLCIPIICTTNSLPMYETIPDYPAFHIQSMGENKVVSTIYNNTKYTIVQLQDGTIQWSSKKCPKDKEPPYTYMDFALLPQNAIIQKGAQLLPKEIQEELELI